MTSFIASLGLIICCLAIVGACILTPLLLLDKVPLRTSSKQRIRKSANATQTSNVSQNIQSRLLTLLNHDRAAAKRLVQKVQLDNPSRSMQWCWEKAVFDLERDRRI
jgi:hypothetical protein